MKINKIIFTVLSITSFVVTGFLSAEQAQQEQAQPQQAQQQAKPKPARIIWNKHNANKNNNNANANVDEFADLKNLLQDIINKVAREHGSVDEMLNQKANEHVRICPTCGGIAAQCPADLDRIAHGEILTCGCTRCGGLQI